MPLETGNMGGVGDFVSALMNRGAVRQQAQDDAWARAQNIGRAKKTAAEARITEDELAQRGGLADAILAVSQPGVLSPEQAAGLATIGRAGFGNFPQLVQGQSGLFDLGQTQRAAQMATQQNPDTAMMNRLLAARVSGGGPLSPQETDPEGLAAALIGTERAQAGSYQANAAQNYASARAADALAGLRARTDPNFRAGGGGSAGAVAGGGKLTPDVIAMLSRPNPMDPTGAPVLDPGMYQSFLEWQQSTGTTGDINADARRWLNIRNPVIVDPTNPASMGRSPPAGLPQSVADTSQLEADLSRDGAPPEAISEIVRSITQGRDFNVQVPAQQRRFTAEDAQQALADAREAIRRGVITPEEAKRRLQAAGMTQTAEFIR